MEIFNTWFLTRSSGIVSYILLSFAVMTGLYLQIQKQRATKPGNLAFLHQPLGNWAFYIGLFHASILLYDRYVHLNWYEIVIPFLSEYHTYSLGIGILSIYGLLLTIITTELRFRIGANIWRKFHIFAPIAYIFATFHGIFIGTDTENWITKSMYMISVTVVALLLMIRFSVSPQQAVPLKKR